jgi:hypothetical protein
MLEVPGAVYTLWIIGLVAAVLVLPVIVILLHHLWRDAYYIERYAAESLAAGIGIAGHTQHIAALQKTIETASGILGTAKAIDQHTGAIEGLLAGRAGRPGGAR